MFDLGLFFIFQNILILMCVYWLLAYLGEKFYKIKYYNNTSEIYECGFRTYHNTRNELNMSFIVIAFLLILYDVEFFFLIPCLFNISSFSLISLCLFWIFIVFVFLSFLIDWSSVLIDWVG